MQFGEKKAHLFSQAYMSFVTISGPRDTGNVRGGIIKRAFERRNILKSRLFNVE